MVIERKVSRLHLNRLRWGRHGDRRVSLKNVGTTWGFPRLRASTKMWTPVDGHQNRLYRRQTTRRDTEHTRVAVDEIKGDGRAWTRSGGQVHASEGAVKALVKASAFVAPTVRDGRRVETGGPDAYAMDSSTSSPSSAWPV